MLTVFKVADTHKAVVATATRAGLSTSLMVVLVAFSMV